MKYNITVRLYSEYRHHGSHGPKPHAVRSAVSSKARGILAKRVSATQGSSAEAISSAADGMSSTTETGKKVVESKSYGTHAGNVHVMTLRKEESVTPDSADKLLCYLDNVTSKFEAMTGFDLKAAKNEYSVHKNEILNRFSSQYGADLAEGTSTEALKELSQYSFDYTQHQIVVIITCDEAFEGSHLVDGLYVRELRSKRVYTKGRSLLTQEQRSAFKNVSDSELLLTRSAHLGKGARIVTNPKTGRLELQIDFGQLGGRIRSVDSY